MQARMFVDVLSHWCLAAIPAARVLADLTPDLEIVFAPTKGRGGLGYSSELMQWFLKRGASAYGREMNPHWFEGPETTTWFANAVALVGSEVSGEPIRTTHAVMSAALEQGVALGRADECFAFMGKYLGTSGSEIAKKVADPRVAAKLDEGNARLAALGADERPTFDLENNIGDRILLKGMWQKELVAAAGLALLHDQRAYAMAGQPPQ